MAEKVVAFGPGRVNLIGEHTDYNDGLAMPFAIERGVTVTARPASALRASTRSTSGERDEFDDAGARATAGARSARDGRRTARGGLRGRSRAHLEISGDLPRGTGLSSSAALEAALALALLGGAPEDLKALAKICSRVENEWVGAETGPAGPVRGAAARAPATRCGSTSATLDVEPHPLELGDWQLVTLDSGATHSIAASGYNERRARMPRGLRGARDRVAARARRLDGLDGVLLKRARHVITENERVDAMARRWTRDDLRPPRNCSTPRTPRSATTTRRACPRSRRPSSA